MGIVRLHFLLFAHTSYSSKIEKYHLAEDIFIPDSYHIRICVIIEACYKGTVFAVLC